MAGAGPTAGAHGRPDVPPRPPGPARPVPAEELGRGARPLRGPRLDHRLPELHGPRDGAGDEGPRGSRADFLQGDPENAARAAHRDPEARGSRPPEGAEDPE